MEVEKAVAPENTGDLSGVDTLRNRSYIRLPTIRHSVPKKIDKLRRIYTW